MFTGLVERLCAVKGLRRTGRTGVLSVDLGQIASDVELGESIAVNGVCLTVSKLTGAVADFDVSAETLARSTLGNLRAPAMVNIERSIRAGGRFGGHFVQGHVDGTAVIADVRQSGEYADIVFGAGSELLEEIVEKGSVAVDGISLTVANLSKDGFSVAVIPETLERTTLGRARVGQQVNIETDIIVKSVKSLLGKMVGPMGGLTMEKLREMGF